MRLIGVIVTWESIIELTNVCIDNYESNNKKIECLTTLKKFINVCEKESDSGSVFVHFATSFIDILIKVLQS